MKETVREMNAKWKEHDREWKEKKKAVDFRPNAFTPTDSCSWKFHVSSTESPPPEKTIRVKKNR
jgi:hypothetical protein